MEPNINVLNLYKKRQNLCSISSITWQELNYGFTKMKEGHKKDYIEDFLLKVRNKFEIIDYDSFAAKICGEILAKSEKKGIPLPYYDAQIAATSIATNMILVSRNVKDFEKMQNVCTLNFENWFE